MDVRYDVTYTHSRLFIELFVKHVDPTSSDGYLAVVFRQSC